MAARTTQTLVGEILGSPTGNPMLQPNWDGQTSLQPYIDKASLMVDRVVSCASRKSMSLTSGEAEMVERWLAAYYYTVLDPLYKSRNTAGGSGSFVRSDNNDYKQAAIESDPSGCLNAMMKQQRASGMWLGRVASEQTDADDRSS